ncbi:MAG: HD domain-containing phosphohydrolase [Planctomycetota bacterium]|jgi:HD-GYP domain-containing protein (c-di-GMP phosphodiesterase class II)
MRTKRASRQAVDVARGQVLEDLLQISIALTATRDHREMLDRILTEARRLSGAQAGSLYVRRGDALAFAVAQNDAVDLSEGLGPLAGVQLGIGGESVAGFAASSNRPVNVPDSFNLEDGCPFRICRDVDLALGYRTQSVLAVPLACPDGEVMGVLQLINRLDDQGRIVPFDDPDESPVMALAAVAAVSVHSALLAERLKQAHLDTIVRLATVAEFRQTDAAEHIQRMSAVCALTSRQMGLDAEQVDLIHSASVMHDIGKVGIPDSILLKPATLTPDERKIVETHTLIGAEILANPDSPLLQTAHDIALYHHERWDGQGYPHRLRGREIPLSARVVCLADVFDALATPRCYKKAYPPDKVVEIVKEENGRHFDPDVVKAFLAVLDDVMELYDLK